MSGIPPKAPSHERLGDPVEVADARPPGEPAATPVQAPAPAAAPAEPPRGWAPPERDLRLTVTLVAITLLGALLALYAWDLPPFARAIQSTDNAYVRGQTTVISPQVGGYVTEVGVQDFESVRRGQLLVRIDQRIYRQRVQQAEANLASAEANLANAAQSLRSAAAALGGQEAAVANAGAQLARAEADMRRVNELVDERSVSIRERDQTLAALRQAEAGLLQARAQRTMAREQLRTVDVGRQGLEAAVEGARAARRLAQIDLENTEIRAPRDGHLGEVGVRVGQLVSPGTQLTFLVPPLVWVVANYREAQTAAMRPGQHAWVTVDALAGARLDGRIERMSPATGTEFAVIKPDNATGNFVKVSQRIGVRIALDPQQPLVERLRPGMSVIARVDTAAPSADSASAASAASR